MLAFFLRMFYNYKAFENCICRSGGMADASDSKSDGSDTVWVRVPPSAPTKKDYTLCMVFLYIYDKNKKQTQVILGLLYFYFPNRAFNSAVKFLPYSIKPRLFG